MYCEKVLIIIEFDISKYDINMCHSINECCQTVKKDNLRIRLQVDLVRGREKSRCRLLAVFFFSEQLYMPVHNIIIIYVLLVVNHR